MACEKGVWWIYIATVICIKTHSALLSLLSITFYNGFHCSTSMYHFWPHFDFKQSFFFGAYYRCAGGWNGMNPTLHRVIVKTYPSYLLNASMFQVWSFICEQTDILALWRSEEPMDYSLQVNFYIAFGQILYFSNLYIKIKFYFFYQSLTYCLHRHQTTLTFF